MPEIDIKLLIKRLEVIRQRPKLYFDDDSLAVVNFINGFTVACDVMGLFKNTDDPIYVNESIVTGRGWEWSSFAPLPEMKERGFDDDQIIQELLTIEIEKWKKLYNIHDT